MGIQLQRIKSSMDMEGGWRIAHTDHPGTFYLSDDELRDLVRQAALVGIYNRTGEPDVPYASESEWEESPEQET